MKLNRSLRSITKWYRSMGTLMYTKTTIYTTHPNLWHFSTIACYSGISLLFIFHKIMGLRSIVLNFQPCILLLDWSMQNLQSKKVKERHTVMGEEAEGTLRTRTPFCENYWPRSIRQSNLALLLANIFTHTCFYLLVPSVAIEKSRLPGA